MMSHVGSAKNYTKHASPTVSAALHSRSSSPVERVCGLVLWNVGLLPDISNAENRQRNPGARLRSSLIESSGEDALSGLRLRQALSFVWRSTTREHVGISTPIPFRPRLRLRVRARAYPPHSLWQRGYWQLR